MNEWRDFQLDYEGLMNALNELDSELDYLGRQIKKAGQDSYRRIRTTHLKDIHTYADMMYTDVERMPRPHDSDGLTLQDFKDLAYDMSKNIKGVSVVVGDSIRDFVDAL